MRRRPAPVTRFRRHFRRWLHSIAFGEVTMLGQLWAPDTQNRVEPLPKAGHARNEHHAAGSHATCRVLALDSWTIVDN
jgi:hypothetical protein